MNFITTTFLAFALAMDAFAVSLAAGASLGKADSHQTFRLSFHFGLFQFMMPIIGWYAGDQLESTVATFDHWIALVLLSIIGGKMILESFNKTVVKYKTDMTKGGSLIALSLATSIDALAVGFSIAVMNVSIVFPSIIIGLVAGLMTLLGIRIGEKFSLRLGRKMELIGGGVLILIGIKILFDHLKIW